MQSTDLDEGTLWWTHALGSDGAFQSKHHSLQVALPDPGAPLYAAPIACGFGMLPPLSHRAELGGSARSARCDDSEPKCCS